MKKISLLGTHLSHSEKKQLKGGALPTLFWCSTTNRCYSKSICVLICKGFCQNVGSSCPWD
jgi:hypothetical protein